MLSCWRGNKSVSQQLVAPKLPIWFKERGTLKWWYDNQVSKSLFAGGDFVIVGSLIIFTNIICGITIAGAALTLR